MQRNGSAEMRTRNAIHIVIKVCPFGGDALLCRANIFFNNRKKTFGSLENYKISCKVANKMPKTPKRWLSLSFHSKPYPFLQIATMVHLAKKLSWHPNSPNERKIYSVSSWFSFVDMCVFPGGQLSLPGLPFFF